LYQSHIFNLVVGCLRQVNFSWRDANRRQVKKPLKIKSFYKPAMGGQRAIGKFWR